MRKKVENFIISVVLIIFCTAALLPVLFMFAKSVTDETGFTKAEYKSLFTDGGEYFFMFLRSLSVATAVTFGHTCVSIAVGFLFGRFHFRGRLILLALYAIVLFLPYSATLLPNYMIVRELNLLNTQWAIILPSVFSPLGVIIMTVFIISVPDETIDAALLETRKLSDIICRIIIPQIIPGIVLTVVITFTEAWNMVEQPQAMMENRLLHPLSVSLNNIFAGTGGNFAGAFIYIIPPILLLWSCRDALREGIMKNMSTGKADADG